MGDHLFITSRAQHNNVCTRTYTRIRVYKYNSLKCDNGIRNRTSVVEGEQNGGELEVEEEQLARGLRDELDERLRAGSVGEARALVGRDVWLAEEAEQLLARELEHESRVRAVELGAPHAQAARRSRRVRAAIRSHSHSHSHTPRSDAPRPHARRRPLRFGGRGRRVHSRRLLAEREARLCETRGARRRRARALELEPEQVANGEAEAEAHERARLWLHKSKSASHSVRCRQLHHPLRTRMTICGASASSAFEN